MKNSNGDLMKNKTIRIALSSVLIYLIFKKSYDILTLLLLWLNAELRIENEYILISANIIIGALSLLLLIVLYNRLPNKKVPKTKVIYFLVGTTIFLSIIYLGIHELYKRYLVFIPPEEYRTLFLFQFAWTKGFDIIIQIFGLIYFLWKLKTTTVDLKTERKKTTVDL